MALRDTFDEAPELYDRVRPDYPAAVFEDLTTLARLRPGSRVLELGCGTGQATVPLATRGFEVVAIEFGAGLADVASRNLAAFPGVDIVNAAFEEWPLPPASFDAVVAATSFHWLDAEVRLAKVADALRSGGRWPSSPPTMSPAVTARSSQRCSAAMRRGCRARSRAFGSRRPAMCPSTMATTSRRTACSRRPSSGAMSAT